MKRYVLFVAILVFAFTSCDTKDEFVNETSGIVEMAGSWYVHYNHSVYGEDPWAAGLVPTMTYNTASDGTTQMWLDSKRYKSYPFTVKVAIDLKNKTFGGTDTVVSVVTGDLIKVVVRNGKITEKVVSLPSGTMADSIYYDIWFEDLEGETGIKNDSLQVSGYRKTGFLEDEPH